MEHLQQAFNFTDDDLAANRAGHTSHAQRVQLFGRYLFYVLGIFLVGNMGLAIAASQVSVYIILGISGICLLIFAYNTYHLHASKHRLNVQCGMILMETTSYKGTPQYKLYRGKSEIATLTEKQAKIFRAGYYCIYFLPFGSQILSITPIPEPPIVDENPPQFDPILAAILNFTADDLIQNQAGFLSPRQAAQLLGNKAGDSIGLVVFLVIASSVILFMGLSAPDQKEGESLLLVVVIAVVIYIASFMLALQWDGVRRDRQSKKVKTLCGTVTYRLERGDVTLTINNKDFKISSKITAALEANSTYRLYYTPEAKVIVAMEKVPEGETST